MSDYKNSLKRTIKTGMNALHMDDATYRDMLERVSESVSGKPKRSITTMSISELEAVLNDMREKGFTTRRGRTSVKSNRSKSHSRRSNKVKERPMIGKIIALWITMHHQRIVKDGSDEAMQSFARKCVNPKRKRNGDVIAFHLPVMTDGELWQIIETLKQWQTREITKQQ